MPTPSHDDELRRDVDALKEFADQHAEYATRALSLGHVDAHDWFRSMECYALRHVLQKLEIMRKRLVDACI